MTQPLIGIPAARIYHRDRPYSPFVFGVKHTFVQAIERAGGVPVILPIYEQQASSEMMLGMLHGILLADGNDISAEQYGEKPRDVRENDPERDAAEIALMKGSQAMRLPILGVCRGMQLMNVARGGTLYQDVVTERPGTNNHDGYLEVKSTEYLAHTLKLEPGTQLAEILGGDSIRSNSHHHQAIKDLGRGLVINAVAEDGVIEGVEDTSGPYFMGVQPHPESIFQRAEPQWRKLFESFVRAAEEYKKLRGEI